MTTLTLGNVTFQHAEIPERLPFGGRQMIAKHQLVGGKRYLDALGPSEGDLQWRGLFLGSAAEGRARYLDQMRRAGAVLNLTWASQRYTVVIEEFRAEFMQVYRIPYHIRCVVQENNTASLPSLPANSVTQQVKADAATAQTLSDSINDPTLTTHMSALQAAIAAVSDFAKATQATLNTVLQPLADLKAQVGVLIASVGNTAENVATLGGVLPNNPVSQGVSRVITQVSTQTQQPALYGLSSVLDRMNGNIGSIGTGAGGRTVSVNNADLQDLAAKYYGDPTQWTQIAQANGLRDTRVTGQADLIIP